MPSPNRDVGSISSAIDMIEAESSQRITFGKMLDGMEDGGATMLLLALTLPNLGLVPSLPLLPFLFGGPAILLFFRIGTGEGWLDVPERIRNLSCSRNRALALLLRVERFAFHRLRLRARRQDLLDNRWLQVVCLAGAIGQIFICLPIPVVNMLPAPGLLVLVLAMVERDGLVALYGASAIGFGCLLFLAICCGTFSFL